jgi:hypothetical protein
MLQELCTPLTMKILGLGCPLYKAERVAAVMVVWVVLLLAMMGFTISVTGMPEREPDNGSSGLPAHGTSSAGTCGILPASTGNTVRSARFLLHTH